MFHRIITFYELASYRFYGYIRKKIHNYRVSFIRVIVIDPTADGYI